jgi:hypothetical protein
MAELIARRAVLMVTVVALLAAGCAGTDGDGASPHATPATADPPAPGGAAAGQALPAPKAPLPTPRPAERPAPAVIAGKVTRPDGTPLAAVQVSFWRRDETGELADIGEHVETLNNGSFNLAAQDWQPEVAALRFRWKRHRVRQVADTNPAQPAGNLVDLWIDTLAIADWSAMAVVVDTGWTASGLVQSLDSSFDVRRIQVMADVIGQSQHVEETGVFVIKDLPWEAERCTIRVYEQGQLLASGAASRPDREAGTREAWVEILVPVR